MKQWDPFCFVIRLLSASLSPQGTNSYARNLGWPTPHPFSLPQDFSKAPAGRQEWGIYEPDLWLASVSTGVWDLSPQDKAQR